MSEFARSDSKVGRFSEIADRLVHPEAAAAERALHGRLITTLLVAPLVLSAGVVQVLAAQLQAGGTLAAVSAVFGLFWLLALLVATTRSAGMVSLIGVAAAALALVSIIGVAGGLASPLAMLATALIIEPARVWRSARVTAACAVAAAACLGGAEWLWAAIGTPMQASPAHWLLPAAYGLVLAFWGRREDVLASDAGRASSAIEQMLLKSAVVVEFDRTGEVRSVEGDIDGILNLPRQVLLAGGLFERIHVADRVHFMCAMAEARSGIAKAVDLRIRARSKGADWFIAVTAMFHSSPDNPDRVFAELRGGEELRSLRGELARAREAVDEIEVTKGRFLARVSHELRTPLNAIIGFSDLMLNEVGCAPVDAKQREYIKLIHESGAHLLDVVNSILDMSKIDAGTYPLQAEPMRFADAVAMSSSMMALMARQKAITVEHQLPANLGELHADRRAVHQILINLISNAVKFTPAGGSVTIGAHRLGTRLHFWVRDTGIGISDEDMARLGKPFVQVQNDYTRQYEGTGLGLSVVKGLVALHDGTMSVESELGQGTTVSISLPLFGPKRRQESSDSPVPEGAGFIRGESDAPIRQAS